MAPNWWQLQTAYNPVSLWATPYLYRLTPAPIGWPPALPLTCGVVLPPQRTVRNSWRWQATLSLLAAVGFTFRRIRGRPGNKPARREHDPGGPWLLRQTGTNS